MKKTAKVIFAVFLGFLSKSSTDIAHSEQDGLDEVNSNDQGKRCPKKDIPGIMLPFPPYMIVTQGKNGSLFGEGIVFEFIAKTFEGCCNDDVSVYPLNMYSSFDTDIEDDDFFKVDLHKADVVFPVNEDLEEDLLFSEVSYVFYDIVKSPGYVLIGRIDLYNEKARHVVLDSLYDSWPIFVLTFLLTGIAGMAIWALEYHVKNEEFPLSFTRGSYEGFWWAFISMTTVGYGDKAPRSFIGRLFSILWILVGLIVITMFTATVTSALTNSALPEFTNALGGMDVGVLKRDSQAEAEARYIGANPSVYTEIADLNNALSRQEVEGIFMETIQAYYHFKDNNDENLRVFQSVHDKVLYKMALNTDTMREFLDGNSCLKTRLENPSIDRLVKNFTKPMKFFKPAVDTEGLLSGHSKETAFFLLIILGISLGLLVLGVLVELSLMKSKRFLRKTCFHKETVTEAGFNNTTDTMKQLDSIEQNLEILASQVQDMRENLSRTNRQHINNDTLKLMEIHNSVS
ncbi:uncharacterized protein [Montipora capricornis]|uniref:uncharacterized protein n=1 Tax=Montipora capricornis TaxID=246305 RepID=UPI0035F1A3DC